MTTLTGHRGRGRYCVIANCGPRAPRFVPAGALSIGHETQERSDSNIEFGGRRVVTPWFCAGRQGFAAPPAATCGRPSGRCCDRGAAGVDEMPGA
jgi:hypothetical protein